MLQVLARGFAVLAVISGMLAASALYAQNATKTSAEPLISWSQKLSANTRFVVLSSLSNEAVLDKETGLVWERTPSAVDSLWASNVDRCFNRVVGGRRGWRMPSISELATLHDPTSLQEPALPAGHPFIGLRVAYMSSTVFGDQFYALAFTIESAGTHAVAFNVATPLSVWCVRAPE